jgi:SAM-dependent methyltransferase
MSTENQEELRAHWDERYRSGQTPWDTGITPPEVQAFWEEQPPPAAGAYAFDIGCGTGLNTLFLARLGLCAIGFDLSGQALRLAQMRLKARGRQDRSRAGGEAVFVQADVSRLPVDGLGAAYALDIGCLHSLPDQLRPRTPKASTAG